MGCEMNYPIFRKSGAGRGYAASAEVGGSQVPVLGADRKDFISLEPGRRSHRNASATFTHEITMTNTRYIPENAQAIEHSAGTVYTFAPLSAIGYRGTRSKPEWHYSFKSEEQRAKHIQAFFASLDASAKLKQQRQAERKQPHTLKVGDVVCNSWGYDQTNVDFYQVMRISAQFVCLQALSSNTTETASMQGTTIAVPGTASGPITQHRVYCRNGS